MNLCNTPTGSIIATNNWIYYTSRQEGDYRLFRMNSSGFNNSAVTSLGVSWFNISGDTVIYMEYSEWDDGSLIYKINSDGTGNTLLSRYPGTNPCIIGDYVYFYDVLGEYQINRMKY
jgi:hypothetical protein